VGGRYCLAWRHLWLFSARQYEVVWQYCWFTQCLPNYL